LKEFIKTTIFVIIQAKLTGEMVASDSQYHQYLNYNDPLCVSHDLQHFPHQYQEIAKKNENWCMSEQKSLGKW